ncbi:DUF6877 family protein [Lederbergia citrisecunda]|uniref:DUF6877 family protein n=1 Tax=Lederbergia citrisecunda TaxID=2833583 RepID=UPI003D2B160D
MKPIQEIAKIAHKLPIEAIQDINQRIKDWTMSGGKEDDPYVWQQLRYAERFVKEGRG